MSQFKQLDERLSVSEQLRPEDIQTAAKQGFRRIINHRPDGEAEDQPANADLAAAAQAAGIDWIHQPVVGSQLGEADVRDFAGHLEGAEGPVLAFCRSGARSTRLWALHSSAEESADVLIRRAQAAGYDLEGMRSVLESRNASGGA